MLSRNRRRPRVNRLCPFGYPVSGTSGFCTARFRFSQKRDSRSVVEIPKQFLGLKRLGGCPNKSAIRPFESHVWEVSKWLFLAVFRRSGDEIHRWPPDGNLRPLADIRACSNGCPLLGQIAECFWPSGGGIPGHLRPPGCTFYLQPLRAWFSRWRNSAPLRAGPLFFVTAP